MEPGTIPSTKETPWLAQRFSWAARATNDGSTIVARNEDGEDFSFDPKKMIVVMPEDQPRTYTG